MGTWSLYEVDVDYSWIVVFEFKYDTDGGDTDQVQYLNVVPGDRIVPTQYNQVILHLDKSSDCQICLKWVLTNISIHGGFKLNKLLFNPTRGSLWNASQVAGGGAFNASPPIENSLEAILTQFFLHNFDWGTKIT